MGKKSWKLSTHGLAPPSCKQNFRVKVLFYEKVIKHLISPERTSNRFVVFVFLIPRNPHAELLKGKTFGHICFQMLLPFWGLRSVSCCQEREAACQQLRSCAHPCSDRVCCHQQLAGSDRRLWLGCCRHISLALAVSPALQLALCHSGVKEAEARPSGALPSSPSAPYREPNDRVP